MNNKVTKIDTELEYLINQILKKRKLMFSIDELKNTELLIKNEIIKIHCNNYLINDYRLIGSKLLDNLIVKYNFVLCEDFIKTNSFLKRIITKISNEDYNPYLGEIIDEFSKILISKSNLNKNCNFSNYITLLNQKDESKDTSSFVRVYGELIPDLKLTEEIAYSNISTLVYITIEKDSKNHFYLHKILKGLKEITYSNENDIGLNFFNTAVQSKTVNNQITSSIVTSLFNKLGETFYDNRLKKILETESIHSREIILGLPNIDTSKPIEYLFIFKIYNLYVDSSDFHILLAKLFFNVLNYDGLKVNDKKTIFAHLNKLIKNDNEDFISYVLWDITHLKKHPDETISLLIELIKQKHFSIEKNIREVPNIFFNNSRIDDLKKVIKTIAQYHPFAKITKNFHPILSKFKRDELELLFIYLLTHNSAPYRKIGNDFIKSEHHDFGYKFNVDILKLPPIKQYKLWVGVTQDYQEPKFSIPCLVPLIQSKSTTVRDAFLYKLEKYSEDYGFGILDILKKNIDTKLEKNKNIIERIKKYTKTFHSKNTDIKKDIKELNPYYSQNKSFLDYNKLYKKHFSKEMNKGIEEGGLFNFFGSNTTLTLAKGGGFKIGDRNEVTPLSTFTSDFSLPRRYFIFPKEYDVEEFRTIQTDWKEKEFSIIEEMILNE